MVRVSSLTGWVLLALFSLSIGTADAAGDKKKKKGRAVAASEGSSSEEEGEKTEKKAEVQPVTASGPTLKYEQFRKKIEIQVAEKREEQIEGIVRLLKTSPPEKEIPDIKFRLAELFFEKSQFFFFRSQEADDQASKATSPSVKDEKLAEKKKHAAETQTWLKRALDIYKEIREKYPKYPRMPEVLFALGQSFWNAGRHDDAIEVYSELIKNHKNSPLVADAWLAFGEFYFNKAELNKALKAYEYAASDKRNRVYGFALYKQGWCYYNLGDWKKALEKFRAVVFYSSMSQDLAGENRIALGREAQKDFVKTYAHQGDPQRAKFELGDLFESDEDCKKPDCLKLLEQLSDLWFNAGQFEECGVTYRVLIGTNPDGTRNTYFQSRIVDAIGRSGDKSRVVKETRRLVELWEHTKIVIERMGSEAKEKAKKDLDEAGVLAESTLRKLSQTWNKEAIKTRQKPTYEFAKTMYVDYLKLFPESKFAYEMRFQLGDLFYKLESFDDAAKMYEATVLADPKGKFLIEAANDNVLALEEHLKDLRLPKPGSGEKASDKPVVLHKERQRLMDAYDRYVKFVPADKADKLVKIKYKAGKMLYDHNHFDDAIKRFEDIVAAHSGDEEAEYAANLVVDIYNLRKDWKTLYEVSTRYLKNDVLIKDREKLHKDLLKFCEYAKFKLVQILEEDIKKQGGNLGPVAKAYEEFQAEFPKSENADKAIFNASVAWDSVGEKEKADGLRQKLLADYPDSPLRTDVLFYIAKSHEERTDFEQAAEMYIQFADKYPTDARARDAMYNAAVFYAGLGKVEKATKLREEYLKKYGTQAGGEKESASIYYTIAQDLERNRRWNDAIKRYEEFAKKFGSDDRVWDALWQQITIRREQLKQIGPAEKTEQTLVGTYESRSKKGQQMPPTAADYASRIAVARIDKDLPKYLKLKIAKPNLTNPKPFQRSVDDKAKAREQMVQAYTGIVTKYKQANSTITSLLRIAEVWDHFTQSLVAVPCPLKDDEQCQYFRQFMEEKIAPARQAALQAYQTCVVKSNELGVFTENSTKCVKALEKLAPESFPPVVERTVEYQRPKSSVNVRSNGLMLRLDGKAAPATEASTPPPAPSKKPDKIAKKKKAEKDEEEPDE